MNGIFSMDGPLYKICNVIYYFLAANFLWAVSIIPAFLVFIVFRLNSVLSVILVAVASMPVGAATTALYYVMRKVLKDESFGPFKDFWKSFKLNFKQATLVWFILFILYSILIFNILNVRAMGSISNILLPLQFAILLELVIITIYIFPMLSKYHSDTKNLFKTSFLLGNMHIPTTLLCVAILAGILYFLFKMPGLLIMLFIGIYIFCTSFFIEKVFLKHWPEEKEPEPEFTSSLFDEPTTDDTEAEVPVAATTEDEAINSESEPSTVPDAESNSESEQDSELDHLLPVDPNADSDPTPEAEDASVSEEADANHEQDSEEDKNLKGSSDTESK